ncbi:site-specific integrase [Stomatohabitans albus]|uniref:tyrosine-type recombinase/integrase n=1 Tax=Stomatohabitans albus TaxID=3110766 RepID=UPI00300CADD1
MRDGKQRQVGTYKTRREAETALAALLTEQTSGRIVLRTDGAVLLSDWLPRWIITNPSIRSPRTVEVYESLARSHILPHLGSMVLADLSPNVIRGWMNHIQNTTPSQAPKAYRLLRASLATAVADGMIRSNPCNIPKAGLERATERPVATVEQVWALADAMPARFRAAVLTMTYASLRFSEAAGLTRQDIDLVGMTIHVRRQTYRAQGQLIDKAPKADSDRVVHIPPVLAEALAAHLLEFVENTPTARVFTGVKGGPLSQQVWRSPWATARSQVDGLNGFHTHDLRHTGNTWAAATGASTRDLMARMGHTSVDAALRYQHATEHTQRAIATALETHTLRQAKQEQA